MNTPIHDFVTEYARRQVSRLHMPGHKGRGPLGCESMDITEVQGADALYEAQGIIAQSEANATALFGSGRTLYSTEGSSQCIRAMLYLAMTCESPVQHHPLCLATRNAHKAFLFAAALCGFEVRWLWPETPSSSLCACSVSADGLERALESMEYPPFCVYVTSPDYLGNQLDIGALAAVCHRRGIALLVDNAHGAYLKFIGKDRHPLDLGADMCCDSAHKTLPVLTGGAYLHISSAALARYGADARRALALFGSTSPSYLILQSLDCANAALAETYPQQLAECCNWVAKLRQTLAQRGHHTLSTEPCKLALRTDGYQAAQLLRKVGVECEYADAGHLVLMFSPGNAPLDYERIDRALRHPLPCLPDEATPLSPPPQAMEIRRALFSPSENIPVEAAEGRICAAPTVSCPPAIPIVMSGERITADVVRTLKAHRISEICVVRSGMSQNYPKSF